MHKSNSIKTSMNKRHSTVALLCFLDLFLSLSYSYRTGKPNPYRNQSLGLTRGLLDSDIGVHKELNPQSWLCLCLQQNPAFDDIQTQSCLEAFIVLLEWTCLTYPSNSFPILPEVVRHVGLFSTLIVCPKRNCIFLEQGDIYCFLVTIKIKENGSDG